MWGKGDDREGLERIAVLACAFVLATGLLAASSPAEADAAGILRPDGRWWRDAEGRVVLLHGVNVVKKVAPYIPSPEEFGPADADRIAALGWNTVRLGFIWAGMQPAPGPVDGAYLARYEEIVNLLGERGIHVLVDAHQDLWNERWGGEGAPDWAVFRPGAAKFSSWVLTYFFTPPLGLAYWDFWMNRNGILDEYVSMWQQVAERFADNPHVLGYDIMNEPWTSPLWIFPQDRHTVQRMYEKVIPAIRAVDSDHTIFWEPSLPSLQIFHDQMTLPEDARLALSAHVYCSVASLFGRDFWPADACRSLDNATIREARRSRDRHSAGWLVTEFGASDLIEGIKDEVEWFDREFLGWQYWEWKHWDDPTTDENSQLVEEDTGPIVLRPKVHVLERTFARRVAGEPVLHRFDPKSGVFELVYHPDPDITSPTEVWLPLDRHYPTGFEVTVDGGDATQSPSDPHILLVTAESGAPEVAIEVTPAA
ncbi:MAG: hypothetical protein DYH08_06665 [Actinobacteria bacterium ATB1]|nr:hypothetical protein [Actinobacteria bacterium ATB1]